MEKFAIACLMIIVVSIQHLINFAWRKTKDEQLLPFCIIAIALALFLTFICFYYITIWWYPLIRIP